MLNPPELIISLRRPTMCRNPSASSRPRSPERKNRRPSGARQIDRLGQVVGGPSSPTSCSGEWPITSPTSPGGNSRSSASITCSSTPGAGRPDGVQPVRDARRRRAPPRRRLRSGRRPRSACRGSGASTSAFSAASKRAEVDCLTCIEPRSKPSKSGMVHDAGDTAPAPASYAWRASPARELQVVAGVEPAHQPHRAAVEQGAPASASAWCWNRSASTAASASRGPEAEAACAAPARRASRGSARCPSGVPVVPEE